MSKITMSIRIDSDLFKKFKYMCALEGCSMTESISELIRKEVESYQDEKKIIIKP